MTEISTSAFQKGDLFLGTDDAPNSSAHLPCGEGIGIPSAAARTRNVLTPSEWRKVAFLTDMGVESLLQEFGTVDDCETWLSFLESDIAKALPDSIRERIRAHVESLLLEYRSKATGEPDVFDPTENYTNSERLPRSDRAETNSSDSPVQHTISHTAEEARPAMEDAASPAGAGGAVSPAPPDRFRFTDPWWEGWGYVPNALLRCSIFAATRTNNRKLKNEAVASLSNIHIKVTGPQLTQPDLDVWMMALYLARHGDAVRINRRAFLQLLERATGSSDREWLTKSLIRLRECHVDVSLDDHPRFAGHLLKMLRIHKRQQGVLDASGHEIELEIDPSMATMFRDGWTRIPFPARAQLRDDPLANWLLGFYLTHSKPKDMKVETLRRLSGTCGSLTVFRRRLEQSLHALQSAGHLEAAAIRQDKVSVSRAMKPNEGQWRSEDREPPHIRRRMANHSRERGPKRNRRNQVELTLWERFVHACRRVRLACRVVSQQCRVSRPASTVEPGGAST